MNEKKVNQLTLSLLGPFQVELDGDVLNHFPTDKVRALLAYLSMEADRPHRRDTLAGLLWTEWPNRQARRNLRKSLYWLRQTLDNHRAGISDELLTITRQTVQLNEGTFTLDVAYFLRLLTESDSHAHLSLGQCPVCLDRLTKAVGLYKGEFLTGFSLADAHSFEEWLLVKRERLQQQVLNTLSSLTAAYEQRQDHEKVQEYAAQQLVLEPWREEAHRQLMRALVLNGQRNEALAQYGNCQRILEDELGVEPTHETTTLYEQIRSGAFKRQIKSVDHDTKVASGNSQLNLEQSSKNRGFSSFRSTKDNQSSLASTTSKRDSSSVKLESSIQQNRVISSSHVTERQPNLQTQAAPLHHFSVQFTPFVGRQTELAQSIDYLLNPACRLLTLCGPGGMGKTRLSIQVGKQIASRLPSYSGIYFISLAEVDSPELVISALVNCLGIPLKGAISAKAQLMSYLQNKRILLVMDNFEHLVNGADLLIEILSHAPNVKMLISSREPLNIRAEWRLILDGLAYPEGEQINNKAQGQFSSNLSDREKSFDLISSYSAIQLFVQAAARIRPDFSPTEKEQAAIVRICQLIGGTPLAIEIAAAWIRMYECEAIAEEIARNLDLMVTPLRDMPSRHRSMRAVFDHSWRLLSPIEQQALAQISVFRGGFSMRAALAITDATPLEFAALLDKSLLRRTLGGRLEIHELLRQFSAEQLGNATDHIRQQHSAYYMSFLEQRTTSLQGGKQQKALTEIDQELKNCGIAWEYAVSQKNIAMIGKGLEGLFHFYDIRSRFQEGELIFREAANNLIINQPVNQTQRDSAMIKAKLDARRGWFTFHLGRTKQSWSLLQNSLALLRELEIKDDILFNLNYLGALARHSGQYERTQDYLSEALDIAQTVDNKLSASIALNILGQVASLQGQYEKARELCRQSLQMKRLIGDRWGMTFSLTYLGRVQLMLGEYKEAKELFQESMTISEIFGDRRGIAFSLFNLGNVAKAQGETHYLEAQRLYQESLYLYNEIGNRQESSLTLIKLGELACELEALHDARFNFRHALSTALEINSTSSMLAGLLGIATLHSCLNTTSLALPILMFIQQSPDATLEQKTKAKALCDELEEPLTKQQIRGETPVKDLISLVQYALS